MFILKNFEYRSEANRFDSDFVLKKTKKNELSFFLKTKGKKRKGSIANYRSFAIASIFICYKSEETLNVLLVRKILSVAVKREKSALSIWQISNICKHKVTSRDGSNF